MTATAESLPSKPQKDLNGNISAAEELGVDFAIVAALIMALEAVLGAKDVFV